MKINNIYNQSEEITIESYLEKCGVKNPQLYLTHNTIEDSSNYKNIEESKQLIMKYIKKPIYILVDCDVDGYMSASIMYIFLKRLNKDIKIIPLFHTSKQHGVSDIEIFKHLKQQIPSLLITPDSSSNDIDECRELNELGWDILVGGEHHEILKEHNYAVIVNNKLGETANINGSGGLVTWHICNYINKSLSKDLISYVAVSLIGDSMDMRENENYTFTYWGKQRIHKNLTPFVYGLNKDDDLTNKGFSFGMVTNCNSLIRLGNQEEKEELFYSLVGEIEPSNIIKKCEYYHGKQSRDSKSLMDEVEIIYNGRALIGKLSEKTPLTGLVANKMMSEYEKPILLVHEDLHRKTLSGSVRSPIEFKDILNDSGLFNYNMGHNSAFGTSYQKDKEQDIIDYLNNDITILEPLTDVLSSYSIKSIPNYLFDFNGINKDVFGQGIPIPQFHIQPFTIYNTDISILGKNGTTIKWHKQGLDFIMFFVGNSMKGKLMIGERKQKLSIECIVELGINEFRGQKKHQAIVNKLEVSIAKEKTLEDLL